MAHAPSQFRPRERSQGQVVPPSAAAARQDTEGQDFSVSVVSPSGLASSSVSSWLQQQYLYITSQNWLQMCTKKQMGGWWQFVTTDISMAPERAETRLVEVAMGRRRGNGSEGEAAGHWPHHIKGRWGPSCCADLKGAKGASCQEEKPQKPRSGQ